jgi:O-methyltransferase
MQTSELDASAGTTTALYLDLMKRVLTNVIYEDPPMHHDLNEYTKGGQYRAANRMAGADWPSVAHTMVGLNRLDNVQSCVEQVLAEGVPGDLLETGVWRGGVCIFMRAILRAHGCTDRTVWVADSFAGIPETDQTSHALDREMALHRANDVLGVPEEVVRRNFQRYCLLDDQVRFLPGWFSDTLPNAPIERLAILRLDGDLYSSTMDVLENLYAKVSPGGFVIIDDYMLPACREAVLEFRGRRGITEPVQDIDGLGAYWRLAS